VADGGVKRKRHKIKVKRNKLNLTIPEEINCLWQQRGEKINAPFWVRRTNDAIIGAVNVRQK
jgi:hypothetical protein